MVAKAIGVSIGLCKPLARSSIANMSVTKWQRECTEKFVAAMKLYCAVVKLVKLNRKIDDFVPEDAVFILWQ